jgi:hypothetical protein
VFIVFFLFEFRFHGGQNCVEAVVVFLQGFSQHGQPLVHCLNAGLREPARALGAVDPLDNESRLFKHFQMLGDRGLRHLEGLREFVHGRFTQSKPRQDRPACGIGESGEGGIQVEALRHKQYVI